MFIKLPFGDRLLCPVVFILLTAWFIVGCATSKSTQVANSRAGSAYTITISDLPTTAAVQPGDMLPMVRTGAVYVTSKILAQSFMSNGTPYLNGPAIANINAANVTAGTLSVNRLANISTNNFDAGTSNLISRLAAGSTSYKSKPGSGITITTNEAMTYLISVYSPPVIVFFANQLNAVEIGSTVNSTILTWSFSGATVTSQSINNDVGVIASSLRNCTHYSSYSTDRTYTLTCSDGTTSASATTGIVFQHKRYWGVSANTSLNDAQIIGLSSELVPDNVMAKTFAVTSAAQYIYYVFPASWGTAHFFDPFQNTAYTLQTTRDFVNASGNHTTYAIYRSSTPLTGSYTITVN